MGGFDRGSLWPKMVIVQLICITLFAWSNLHVAMSGEVVSVCSSGGKYANGSKFESNVNTVLNNLVHSAKLGLRFNTSSYGENPDKIYGLLQCRGDSSQAECYDCSQDARTGVRAKCGNAPGGRVGFDQCYLRYENNNFISKLDTSVLIPLLNSQNVTDPETFNGALRSFLSNLSANASEPANGLRYSSGSIIDSSFQKIFALVQCWEDISSDDCSTCLSAAIEQLFGCCAGKRGAQVWLGSCIVRYELYSFFNSPPPSPPAQTPTGPNPSAETPSRPPQTTSNPPSETKSSSNRYLFFHLSVYFYRQPVGPVN